MWQINSNISQEGFFLSLEKELQSLVEGEKNLIANLSNICSWIYHSFPDLNWCGFYLWVEEDQQLVLGPFQGKPACIRIPLGKGVCGKAFQEKRTIRVDDVLNFPGHIACDSASLSELVIPLIANGKQYGVLDLDSPKLNNFSEKDESEFTHILNGLTSKIF